MNDAVFDAGALIAVEKRSRKLALLVDTLVANQRHIYVSAGVLAQVWRGHARQHGLGALLRTDAVVVVQIDKPAALQIGLMLAKTHSRDVVDAHVALLARQLNADVFTSDAADILHLDTRLTVHTI